MCSQLICIKNFFRRKAHHDRFEGRPAKSRRERKVCVSVICTRSADQQCSRKRLIKGGRVLCSEQIEIFFVRLLVIGQSRQIDLRDLLTHEPGPVPWSLATYDGSLGKTNKSALAKLL